MIVEDERDAREVLVAMLEHRGAVVLAASSAAEAVNVLAHATNGSMPDVLVSDIGMPGEDGFDLITRVRAMKPEQGGGIPGHRINRVRASRGPRSRARCRLSTPRRQTR